MQLENQINDKHNSPIVEAFRTRLNDFAFSPTWNWKSTIRTVGGESVEAFKTTVLTQRFNLEDDFAEVSLIQVKVSDSLYRTVIYPNRSNLTLDVVLSYSTERTSMDLRGDLTELRYRAILIDPVDRGLETSNTDLVEINLQLIDMAVEPLLTKIVGGIYHGSGEDVLTALLSPNINTVRQSSNQEVSSVRSLQGIKHGGAEVETTDNRYTGPWIIPTGKPLIELPDYLHREYGLYERGVGNFIYRGIWYVWPLRHKASRDVGTLEISNIDHGVSLGSDRSYLDLGEQNYLINAIGRVTSIDTEDGRLKNEGNGFRQALASRFIDSFAVAKAGDVEVTRSERMLGTVVRRDEGNLNRAPYTPERIGDNVLKHLSRLNVRTGRLVNVEWASADPGIIEPGMNVKFHSDINGTQTAVKGSLVGFTFNYATNGGGMLDTLVSCSGQLLIWLDD